MKKLLIVLVTLAAFSCGKDNSSTVSIQVGGNGCFISAADFDERSEFSRQGVRTVNYVWDCADYTSLLNVREFDRKRVSLTFTETVCLQLQAEMVTEGLCFEGKVPIVQ
jgi:hypothetical protein